ncbi:Acetyltransferase (GNAT) domain-containing protein [Oscillibacter sp. PC13]|uniref:GNAT family N-acetyltransferase n=1 Tax=Oscillibacter sp. PC13 TaxID=1855299 RepID=UPI0008EB6CCE|nr:GNAT family N-acetyltransferase [Oscillibacter sp. PC13]SFP76778.1 Acetyltransferase (GNAT) domain-containing protein [Oscillibacter sp. PC13]
MIEYRKIDVREKQELTELMNIIIAGLENKDFFLPFTAEEIDAMFDENNAVTYGAYNDGKLVATSQLYLGDEFVDEIKVALGIENVKAAEFGGVMVLKECRNKGIMKHFSSILVEEARKRGYDYIVACAHSENIPSNSAIMAIGAKLMKTGDLIGHCNRNMYLFNLKNAQKD